MSRVDRYPVPSERVSRFPIPGDRVGFVCGPGENPGDNSGIVLAIYSSRFYDNNAVILMDDGRFKYSVGQFNLVGIGMYLIQPAREQQQ